jgi:chromosome segregation protein
MLIKEVILENFMSYEYARIPLKPGVNVICGPNGSGKSSTLIGISVVLGQSYTERSRKLSGLIQWGKDTASVSLVFDNSRRGRRRRPVPQYNTDDLRLTRGLRKDGNYWFEINYRYASKSEVRKLLSGFGIDPDNLLIIMHQNMVEQFSVVSPQDKLKMMEEAVGFKEYRENILDARKKLSGILSEKEALSKLLESAEQTLTYWKEQYERYRRKEELKSRRTLLSEELAWAEVMKQEKVVSDWEKKIESREEELSRLDSETRESQAQVESLSNRLQGYRSELRGLWEDLAKTEGERGRTELGISLSKEEVSRISNQVASLRRETQEWENQFTLFRENMHSLSLTDPVDSWLSSLDDVRESSTTNWLSYLTEREKSAKDSLSILQPTLKDLEEELTQTRSKVKQAASLTDEASNGLLDGSIRLSLSKYRMEILERELSSIKSELSSALSDLESLRSKAEKIGPRVQTTRSLGEIITEIQASDGYMAALSDVSADSQKMYNSYLKVYTELQSKSHLIEENRKKVLSEVEDRMSTWRSIVKDLLARVNPRYQEILGTIGGTGSVRLVDSDDIEAAGVEIFIGFKGAFPVALDAYTQSGGERSVAVMAILLALQQDIKSPFRAVDEYDVHMDPRNREAVSRFLVSAVKSSKESQYLMITPGMINFADEDTHIITVQNVEGKSQVREVV